MDARNISAPGSTITQELRDLPITEARHAAIILHSYRDAATDGVTQDGEFGYWLSKIGLAIDHGVCRGYYVNGGSCCGVWLALPDDLTPGRWILLAANSMWDQERSIPAMRNEAREIAAAAGVELVERVVTVEMRPV